MTPPSTRTAAARRMIELDLAAKPNQLGAWLQAMLTRAHHNVVVAKLARIAWAVLRHEKDFNREAIAAV